MRCWPQTARKAQYWCG